MTKRFFDFIWLALLIGFVFAIPPTFHGDESMYLSMSRDYATLIIDRNPNGLLVYPPYQDDSDEQLRLLNGSVQRYMAGFIWHLAGASVNDLPTRPGWNWQADYEANAAQGHVPTATVLAAGRLASALCFALSIVAIFALAWLYGGRLPAYFVSAIYALNPILLLNGRRSMQEGSLLLFGILVVLIAVVISKRRAEHKPTPIALWVALAVAGALALVSKQSGMIFAGGAFGWIFVTENIRRPSKPLQTTLWLVGAGGLLLALFVALSPGLWSDPVARFGDSWYSRSYILTMQVTADPNGNFSPLLSRLGHIVTEPFMTPIQHFEVAGWANYPQITAAVDRYMASPFSGVQFGVVLGGIVTLLALVGVLFSLRRGWQAGVLVWLGLTVASLLVNPLLWQRYFLPLIPVYALLAGIGVTGLARRFKPTSSPVPDSMPERPASPAG